MDFTECADSTGLGDGTRAGRGVSVKLATCIQTLVTLALLCAVAACGVDRADPASSQAGRDSLVTDKPNIIIFLVDDMGLMDTSVPMLPMRPVRLRPARGTTKGTFSSWLECSPTTLNRLLQ